MSAPRKPLPGADGAAGGGREVYFEFVPIGNSVKVMAVDAKTGLEVSIVGPAHLPRAMLQKNALNKLNYMMEKTRDA